jgi:hypothetical protein
MMCCSQSGKKCTFSQAAQGGLKHHDRVVIFDEVSQEWSVSYKFSLCISASEHGFHRYPPFVFRSKCAESILRAALVFLASWKLPSSHSDFSCPVNSRLCSRWLP